MFHSFLFLQAHAELNVHNVILLFTGVQTSFEQHFYLFFFFKRMLKY